MEVRALALVLVAALAGCATTPAVWTPPKLPDTVLVPVAAKCPAPIIPARPDLPLNAVKPGDPPATVVKAYAETVQVLEDYAGQLEAVLQGYLTDSEPKQ